MADEAAQVLGTDDSDYVSPEEQNWALLGQLGDAVDLGTLTVEQKDLLKRMADSLFEASTAKERLYNEAMALSDKIEKLNSFLKQRDADGVRVVTKLPGAQIYLLNKQLEVMEEYNNILVARYSVFDVKRGE